MAGQSAEVTKLLTPLPDGMSKAFMKKLVKQADVNAKKLSQGKTTQSPGAPSADKSAKAPQLAAKAAETAPGAAGSASAFSSGGNAEGDAIVADILARAEALGISAETLATLQTQREALSEAIAPRLNAIRNRCYVQGFNARD